MTTHESKPSYLGDPLNFCFPSPSSDSLNSTGTSSSSSDEEYHNALGSPNITIERAGSVLIKSGFNKVPQFNMPYNESLLSLQHPSLRPFSPIDSDISIRSNFSYNGSICSVHDVIGAIEEGDLKREDFEGNHEYSENDQEVISMEGPRHKNDEEEEEKEDRGSNDNEQEISRSDTLQSSKYPSLDEEIKRARNNSSGSASLNNETMNPYLSKTVPTADTSVPKILIISDNSSGDDDDWEDIGNKSFSIPRRSSRRMLIYQELGVEPDSEVLLDYVKSQQSFNSPKSNHEKKRSQNMDNLTKMMEELQQIQDNNPTMGGLDVAVNANADTKSIKFDSSSTKSFARLRSHRKRPSNASTLSSPLKLHESQFQQRIDKEQNANEEFVVPFDTRKSILKKGSSIKRSRISTNLSSIGSKSLPSLPQDSLKQINNNNNNKQQHQQEEKETCELKRSPAIKRKRFVDRVVRVIKGIWYAPARAYRGIRVKGKKLFTFGRKKPTKRPITIGLPQVVNIENTSFGPEILSTFGAYGGEPISTKELKKENSIKSMKSNSRRVASIATGMDSELLSYWTHLMKTSISTRTEMKIDLEQLSKMEYVKSITTTISRNNSLKYDDMTEMLLNKYILSDSGTSVATSDICSSNQYCESCYTNESTDTCSLCDNHSGYTSGRSVKSLSSLEDTIHASSSSSISSVDEVYTEYSMIEEVDEDEEDDHHIHANSVIEPQIRSEGENSEQDEVASNASTSIKSSMGSEQNDVRRTTIRPSMRFTDLKHILKNNGSIKRSAYKMGHETGAAESWRPKLIGPRPMPLRSTDVILESPEEPLY